MPSPEPLDNQAATQSAGDTPVHDQLVRVLERLDARLAEPAAIQPELLDLRQTAQLAGFSPRNVEAMVSAGQFPRPLYPGSPGKTGRCRRWRRADVMSWIDGGCRPVSEWQARQALKNKASELSAVRAAAAERRSA